MFETIYHEQFGLSSFLPPFLLLVVITYAEGAVLAPLRACGTGAAECTQVFFGAGPQLVISAIAGAYMFAVSDAVISIRRRSLNVSDVYWYALRAFLALPIATLFAQAPGVDGMKPVFAFAVAMLPVDVLLKQIRRLAYPPAVAQANPEEQGDQLLMLTGVTTPVVGLFLSEGVYSVEQIAASDPVLLAIRTGLPFRFVIRLGGQAIVRRHLGDRARELIPLGLADAGPIVELVKRARRRPGFRRGDAGRARPPDGRRRQGHPARTRADEVPPDRGRGVREDAVEDRAAEGRGCRCTGCGHNSGPGPGRRVT